MKIMKKFSLAILSLFFLLVISCNEKEEAKNNDNENVKTNVKTETVVFNTVDDLVADAKKKITEITPEDFKAKADAEEAFVLIDLRSEKDFSKSHITGAVNIPRGVLEFRINKDSFWEDAMIYTPKKDELIILYCKSGKRSALAALTLKTMGYTNVKCISGGIKAFKELYPNDIEIPGGAKDIEPAVEEEDDGGC